MAATLTMLILSSILVLTMVNNSNALCGRCSGIFSGVCCSRFGLCCANKPGVCPADPFPNVGCRGCFNDSSCPLQQKCCPFGANGNCCSQPATATIATTPTATTPAATTPTATTPTATTPTTPVAG